MELSEYLLETRKVCKLFPGVQALIDVDFTVRREEVHVLLGENGAGKSTLIKILSGAFLPDSGSIFFNGQEVHFSDPGNSLRLGVSVLYQEPNLVPNMTLSENIHLGNERKKTILSPAIDEQKQIKNTLTLFDELNLALDPYALVSELSLAEQQMVAIARALHLSANLVILDEPTAMLSQREVSQLFSVIRKLRARGMGIVYVTHRLEEAMQIGDRASILRDGHKIATLAIDETTRTDLIQLILGHGITDTVNRPIKPMEPEILRLEHIYSENGIQDISFNLHAGEILGITGLVGAGGTNLLQTIFGVQPASSGTIFFEGKPVKINSPQDAISMGIGFLTENRQEQGLVLEMNAQENMTMAALDEVSVGLLIDQLAENRLVKHYARRFNINANFLGSKTRYLSGGTQQKVILSRWLASRCRVLLLDEPSRGIDVGARAELYKLLNELTRRGMSMIIVSSNLPEVFALSDRIAVLRHGQLADILPRSSASPAKVLALTNGGAIP
jgi:ABC-type sugar transport system ATPase subunit